jgi:hypothetical protein
MRQAAIANRDLFGVCFLVIAFLIIMKQEDKDNIDVNKNLKGAIIETIAFFDMFDHPLTDLEIWENLNYKCGYAEVRELLSGNSSAAFVESKNGFYFLPGRRGIYDTRMRRYNYAGRKFKRAVRIAKIFKAVPWIRMIAVGNLMGANNLRDGSDIDFFIIAEQKRVWLTRLFCVIMTMAMGLRPSAEDTRDKICLSFFASEEKLALRGLMLSSLASAPFSGKKREDADPYFVYWLAGLVPIYDTGGMYGKLIAANQWLREALPNWFENEPSSNRQAGRPWPALYHDIIDFFCGRLEAMAMAWQIKRLPAGLKEMMNRDTKVVVDEKIIKLHTNDRREEYRKKFNTRIDDIFKR